MESRIRLRFGVGFEAYKEREGRRVLEQILFYFRVRFFWGSGERVKETLLGWRAVVLVIRAEERPLRSPNGKAFLRVSSWDGHLWCFLIPEFLVKLISE